MEPPNAYDRRFANPAWKSVFNWTLTYRLDADLVYPYGFYLAFENNLCKDYVTEKFFKIFKRNTDTIPVVRGGADYKKYFPPGTFINTADFKSPKQLAGYLKKLESDPLAYAAMLERKDRYYDERSTIM
nr:hypothetical protein BaRGS_018203 [Batillaria attramentaria]